MLNLLSEYKKVVNLELIQKTKQANGKVVLRWADGVIGDAHSNPLDFVSSGFRMGIPFEINFATKKILVLLMDDRSDFRFIKQIQQALNDFLRLKFIDLSYNVTIGNGYKEVSIKTILKYNSDFDKIIPIAYHGTSAMYHDKIKKYGLLPSKYTMNTQWDFGYTDESDDSIYLTIDLGVAIQYARHACAKIQTDQNIKTKQLIVVIKDLPVDNIVPDDDIINMPSLQLLSYIGTGNKYLSYIDSIRTTGQFALRHHVPPQMISKIIIK